MSENNTGKQSPLIKALKTSALKTTIGIISISLAMLLILLHLSPIINLILLFIIIIGAGTTMHYIKNKEKDEREKRITDAIEKINTPEAQKENVENSEQQPDSNKPTINTKLDSKIITESKSQNTIKK